MLAKVLTANRAAIILPILLALLCYAMAMNYAPLRDDFFHRDILQRSDSFLAAINHLFSFTDLYSIEQRRHSGQIPWWTAEQLELNFWRPLAAISHWLDYQLWPDNWMLMHLHSLLWFALVCGLLGYLLTQLGCHGPLLWLVMTLFALDANHYVAVSWLANRNVMVASVFGLLALIWLRRWQQSAKPVLLLGVGLSYGLALLSAEAGIAFAAYLLVLLLLFRQQPAVTRGAVALGVLIITLVWRLIYQRLGYGANGSGLYLDPIGDLSAFLPQVLVTGSTLLLEQIFRIPTFAIVMSPPTLQLQVIINLVLLALTLLLLWPLLKRHRLVQFGALAGTLSLLPLCASSLVDVRLLFIPSLGLWLSMAVWFKETLTKPASHYRSKIYGYARLLITALLILVVVIVNWKSWAYRMKQTSGTDPFLATMDILSEETAQRQVVVINPPLSFSLMYLPLMADYFAWPEPAGVLGLVPGTTGFEWRQLDANRVALRNPTGFQIVGDGLPVGEELPTDHSAFMYGRIDRFFSAQPFQLGQTMNTQAAKVEIASITEQGDPTELVFEFSQPLAAEHWVFLWWDWSSNSYQRLVEIPADWQVPGPLDAEASASQL